MKLRYYISGHGLGHASRSGQIIQTLRRRHPELAVEVVSTAAPWFLRAALGAEVELRADGFDVGVVQHDSLRMDETATLQACRALQQRRAALLGAEVESLQRAAVDLVVADIPFLPFAAAATAGIAAVGVSNFSWDWIYRGLAAREPGLATIAELAAADYRQGLGVLSLPFAAGLDAFARQEPMPLVARRAGTGRAETRRRLGLPETALLGLISFGGFGLEQVDLLPLAALRDWIFLLDHPQPQLPANVRVVTAESCPYPDLVAAADAIISKPGYGIVSEAIAQQTALLYVRRGDFREQAYLIEGLRRYARAAEIAETALREGDWGGALEKLLQQPPPREQLALDGDVVAADRLAGLAKDGHW